jgi:RNA polymerase sigma-70 factor (ECF subfamily)
MSLEARETQLINRASQGDAEAFGDLYEQHLDDIYQYVYYRVGNHQDAEDLTELTFLKAWKSIPHYRVGKTPFRGWLYRIAHNAVIDAYRTRKSTLPLPEVPSIPDGNPSVETQLVSGEQSEQLARAIRRLSPVQQDVLILRFIKGLTAREVGDILDKTAGAVRVMQHRALKTLRGHFGAKEETHA